jgi:hypothetical protein
MHPGSATQPAILVMDDIAAKYSGAFTVTDNAPRGMAPAECMRYANAARELSMDIGSADLVWADNHPGNMAFVDRGGVLRAVIVDADMVMRASQAAS